MTRERMRGVGRLAAAFVVVSVYAGCDTKGENIPLAVAKYHPPYAVLIGQVRVASGPPRPEELVRIADEW